MRQYLGALMRNPQVAACGFERYNLEWMRLIDQYFQNTGSASMAR